MLLSFSLLFNMIAYKKQTRYDYHKHDYYPNDIIENNSTYWTLLYCIQFVQFILINMMHKYPFTI